MNRIKLFLLLGIFFASVLNSFATAQNINWPVLKIYDQDHLTKIALPLGGIGTGTVSLGGRGDLRDWEIMNRPAKGFVPFVGQQTGPFFAIYTKSLSGEQITRALEGPLPLSSYENSHGSTAINHGLPRFRYCSFETAYPLGQVVLSDPKIPVDVRIQAFNPLIPGDTESSGIPVAILRYVVFNKTQEPLEISICGNIPNFIGRDGTQMIKDWKGDWVATGGKSNYNKFRQSKNIRGIFMQSKGVNREAEQWGTIALTTITEGKISCRTAWLEEGWGTSLLDFWDDFRQDGILEERKSENTDVPMGSLAVKIDVPPSETKNVTFLVTWHFPNRYTWTPKKTKDDLIGNYYTTRHEDAWDVAEKIIPRLVDLEESTVDFVKTFCESTLPEVVKEAALFNISTLRTQTCFRTKDGRFFGFEGSSNKGGCCHGSCTHVWNYEQATAFLFGELALNMREVEFGHASADNGLMSFRVALPLERAREFNKGAADGQMGCIMKVYRDWQLSGNDNTLKNLWPSIKKALKFCWIPGGWDADSDGVMEGAQHNTMDVEYYGPNPQMGLWYLGALRAAEEMAIYLGDDTFASTCRELFERGRDWIDSHLFNGEYYEHLIQPPKDRSEIAASLLIGMGTKDTTNPDYQLGNGCLVDQMVGQFMSHVCGLGYLVNPAHVKTTLKSIMKYNLKNNLNEHFNCMRSFALGEESALLMASYPKGRPDNPFPYFTEVMTGFEYTAAVGMLYEGLEDNGLRCIQNIRQRYDGHKRNPFDEAECGHHYARAMASWAAVLALSGFRYSGTDKTITFAPKEGTHFWSNGAAWGMCRIRKQNQEFNVELTVKQGKLELKTFKLGEIGQKHFDEPPERIEKGEKIEFQIPPEKY
ncbi:MAG: hypothetical protein JSV17_17280 [Candidatus Aminicenantes bacterium]|nr:MAG: hypothetical protein JSV17_17280 [Candidatus Aminicenantes bacterium]